MSVKQRIANEIRHGREIKDKAEKVWGWTSPAGALRADRRFRLFQEIADVSPRDRVLELGCGSGVFTQKIADSGAEIVATDISKDLLELAGAKGIPHCRFEVADAHALSYESSSFDVVFGSSVLHHLNIDIALSEIFRVLKPGGRLVFAEPNMLNPHIALIKNVPWLKRLAHESPDESAFFRWKIARKLEEIGFSSVSVEPYDFLYPLIPRRLLRAADYLLRKLEKVPVIREFAGSILIYAEKTRSPSGGSDVQ